MSRKVLGWGFLAVAPLLGVQACSGKSLHDVGDINSGGHSGASGAANHAGAMSVAGDAGSMSDAGADGDPGGRTSGGAPSDGGAPSHGGAPSDGGAPSHGGAPGGGAPGAGAPNGGAAGDPGIVDAGAGGDSGLPLGCETCAVVAEDQDVRGVAVTGGKVYWIDYGKFDSLKNYDYNGRLFARDADGGSPSMIADGLPGPTAVSVNGDFAYVFVERRTQVNYPYGLLRVPLAGGAPVEVSTGSLNDNFTSLNAAPGYEYWLQNGALLRAANTANGTKESVLNSGVNYLVNDGTTLFYSGNGVWALPVAGGAAVQLSTEEPYDVVVSGDYLYAREGHYLDRIPKAGGVWKRIASLPEAWRQPAVDGDRLFYIIYDVVYDNSGGVPRFNLYTAPLATPTKATRLLDYDGSRLWPWVVAPNGVFYGNNHALYFIPSAP